MNNFLTFIDEDIEAKKTLISTLPVNTKTNKKKFNEKIDYMLHKYSNYKESVKKYIDCKNKTFNLKNNNKDIEKLTNNVTIFEHIKFILNPNNTYIEKMGFDSLMYQISNYSDFQFDSLNDIINGFLDKFELAGIILKDEDFNYTCYVNEYMSAFIKNRNSKNKSHSEISEIFEKIYWINPDLISHVELNFRLLIRKNSRKFESYINKLKKDLIVNNDIKDYNDCLKKLKEAYIKLYNAQDEDIYDIVENAKKGVIDINHYLEDSKVRSEAYSTLAIDSLNLEDKKEMEDFYSVLNKLKLNIEEYSNYIQFIPIVDDFKNTYSKYINNSDKNYNKNLKEILNNISKKEKELFKVNRKIFGKIELLRCKNLETLKNLKIDSVNVAKELQLLYKKYDEEYFNQKVLSHLNNKFTISELLNLYYSYDYFKKSAIKRVFNLQNYDDLTKYSDNFDLFSMNPMNVIVEGIPLFEDNDIKKVIINKYRLENINLTNENLNEGDIPNLLDKINFLLRINKIEQSNLSVEKIWFIVKVEKINSQENK